MAGEAYLMRMISAERGAWATTHTLMASTLSRAGLTASLGAEEHPLQYHPPVLLLMPTRMPGT